MPQPPHVPPVPVPEPVEGSGPGPVGLPELSGLAGGAVLPLRDADVGVAREARRRRRFVRLTAGLWTVVGLAWLRVLTVDPGAALVPVPAVDPFLLTIIVFFGLLLALAVGQQVVAGRSPHVTYRPEQIEVGLADVVGLDGVRDDAVRSLNLFLAHRTFRTEMGGTPRRALLFEGPPGTGKTHLARALAREAGVPFLFASATSFQSMWYGATARKVRAYFKALRKAARREGGAIGFLEEIDALAVSRGGVSTATSGSGVLASGRASCAGTALLPALPAGATASRFAASEGTGGVVNELLVQMQSFDALTAGQRVRGWLVDRVNLLLPPHRAVRRPAVQPANVLLIAATNRADSLDPALLRPGRFDRRLTFELPAKRGRRALVDHFLARKAHDAGLDDEERRDALAALTSGYSPVRIEHLLDEALVNAVRCGRRAMTWADVETARLAEEVGLAQPVDYTAHERRLIATHEAGHATMAWLTAPERRLEVLTIVKRRGSLGLLAHGDREDVYTRSSSELRALIQIALAGQCAEELFFGDVSTGPGGDLVYATSCAAEMVGAHGMDGTLVSYLAVQGSALSDTNLVGRVLADDRGRAQLERLLQEQKEAARAHLAAARHLVEALRDALLEREELIGSEITDVLEAAAQAPVVDLRDAAGEAPGSPATAARPSRAT